MRRAPQRTLGGQLNEQGERTMKEIRLDASPRALARAEGVVYLIIIVLGIFVELFVRGRIVVGGDAAATAANLTAMQSLWRVGIVAELLMVICTVCSALFLYLLLRPVSRHLALLATFFGLVGLTVEAGYSLYLVEALFPLQSPAALQAFTAEQLHAMASLALKAHGNGFGIALFLFGPAFLLRGYMRARSDSWSSISAMRGRARRTVRPRPHTARSAGLQSTPPFPKPAPRTARESQRAAGPENEAPVRIEPQPASAFHLCSGFCDECGAQGNPRLRSCSSHSSLCLAYERKRHPYDRQPLVWPYVCGDDVWRTPPPTAPPTTDTDSRTSPSTSAFRGRGG
jgi:hypothetical protein